jgi:tRNA (guanine-N7-)-methyltransferase
VTPTLRATVRGRESGLAELGAPLPLEEMVPGDEPWEVEVGFGRGSYLVRRAQEGGRRLLGVEMAARYYRILNRRARHWRLDNLVTVCCEAQFLLSAALPRAFAEAVHVYFPDPWPKERHHKRRLFAADSVDLVLGLLAPGGKLFFATDFVDYGELVYDTLTVLPGLAVERFEAPWHDGARTNYEAKYIEEGRAILRLVATVEPTLPRLHPAGARDVVCALR